MSNGVCGCVKGEGEGGKERFNNILTGYQIKGALQRKPRQKKCADFEILT